MAEQNEEEKSNIEPGFKRDLDEIRKKIEAHFERLASSIEILKGKLLDQLRVIEDIYDRDQQEHKEALDNLEKASECLETNLVVNRLREVLGNSLALFETEKEEIIKKGKAEKKAVCVWNWELEQSLENICSVDIKSRSNTGNTEVSNVGVDREDQTNANANVITNANTNTNGNMNAHASTNTDIDVDITGNGVETLHNNLVNSAVNKGNGLGEMNCPTSLVVTATGVIFAADSNNDRVCVFLPKLDYFFHFGDKITFGKMSYPRGIAVSQDILFVSNSGSDSISCYYLNGEFIKRIGTGGSKIAEFKNPEGLAYDEVDRVLYVCDKGNNRVQAFNNKLDFKREILRNELVKPLSIRTNNSVVVILDEGETCLHYVDKSSFQRTKDIVTRGPEGQVKQPTSFEVSSEGSIYISDPGNDCIAVFQEDGVWLSCIGKDGVLELPHPMGLAWTREGHLLCLCWNDKQQLLELF